MLPLTIDTLRAAYDYIATTPPFNKWNLPEGEDVVFKVMRWKDKRGDYYRIGDRHHIRISSNCVGHSLNLIETMAHEMIHLHEGHSGADRGKGEHSAAFFKWAKIVCQVHGFDFKAF